MIIYIWLYIYIYNIYDDYIYIWYIYIWLYMYVARLSKTLLSLLEAPIWWEHPAAVPGSTSPYHDLGVGGANLSTAMWHCNGPHGHLKVKGGPCTASILLSWNRMNFIVLKDKTPCAAVDTSADNPTEVGWGGCVLWVYPFFHHLTRRFTTLTMSFLHHHHHHSTTASSSSSLRSLPHSSRIQLGRRTPGFSPCATEVDRLRCPTNLAARVWHLETSGF